MWLRASCACYIPYTFSSVQTHKRETRNDAIMVHRRPSSARLHWPGDSQMESQEPSLNSDGKHSKRNTGLDRHPLLPQHPLHPPHLPHTTSNHLLMWEVILCTEATGYGQAWAMKGCQDLQWCTCIETEPCIQKKFWGAETPLDTKGLQWHL